MVDQTYQRDSTSKLTLDAAEELTGIMAGNILFQIPPAQKETILDEAARLTSGERQKDYGHPLDTYTCAANILRALILHRYKVDIPVTADFVLLFMAAGIKGSREAGGHKRDNLADLAGYARTIEMTLDEEEKRSGNL